MCVCVCVCVAGGVIAEIPYFLLNLNGIPEIGWLVVLS